MKEWLRLISKTLGVGLLWAAVWAAAGALISRVDANGSLNDVWLGPPIGLQPGFVGGVVFSALLGIAARQRKFGELSFSKVIACGAIVGFLLGLLPFGINQPPGTSPLWLVAGVVLGSMTLMSAISAAGSLALARAVRG